MSSHIYKPHDVRHKLEMGAMYYMSLVSLSIKAEQAGRESRLDAAMHRVHDVLHVFPCIERIEVSKLQ